jgi:hypothetical protein
MKSMHKYDIDEDLEIVREKKEKWTWMTWLYYVRILQKLATDITGN